MHPALVAINVQLDSIVVLLKEAVPSEEAFGLAHGNWSFPGLDRAELIEEAQSIIDLIAERGSDEITDSDRLTDYLRRLKHLQSSTIPNLWGNAGQAVSAYMLTLHGLRKAIAPSLIPDEQASGLETLKKLNTQRRAIEARLKDLEPRTTSIAEMVGRIEKAYEAADKLPIDLESLSEARQEIESLVGAADKDQSRILNIHKEAVQLDARLRTLAEEAEAVLKRCETAYSAATSVGLAAAFGERSAALTRSTWVWVLGLLAALTAGGVFGSERLRALADLASGREQAASTIVLNVVLSLLSLAAPVWFAWLATKQIDQRFRLAEDYAYKASISRAYEGFRREAARIDKQMEGRLLESALARLDELPLRLVEKDSHGSPWHELADSEAVKQAVMSVPELARHVADTAGNATNSVLKRVKRSTDGAKPPQE